MSHATVPGQQREALALTDCTFDSELRVAVSGALEIEAQIGLVDEGIVAESKMLKMFQCSFSDARRIVVGNDGQTKEIFLRLLFFESPGSGSSA